MKTQFILLYDQECPLCVAYTQWLLKKQFIAKETHTSFQKGINKYRQLINETRAHNEIACINTKNHEVCYGAEALIRVVFNQHAFLQKLLLTPPIYWLIRLIYFFISYNRQVIIRKEGMLCACAPCTNWTIRILFVLVCASVSAFAIGKYFGNYLPLQLELPYLEVYLFTVQLLVQMLVFKFLRQENLYDYLGHLAMSSLMGSFLLLFAIPLLELFDFFEINIGLLAAFYFGGVVLWTFNFHKHRVEIMGWKNILSYTWLLTRFAFFFILF